MNFLYEADHGIPVGLNEIYRIVVNNKTYDPKCVEQRDLHTSAALATGFFYVIVAAWIIASFVFDAQLQKLYLLLSAIAVFISEIKLCLVFLNWQ